MKQHLGVNASDLRRAPVEKIMPGCNTPVRLLAPETVALLHTSHTEDKYRQDARAFGFGFWLNNDPGLPSEFGRPGAFGWGSAYFPKYLVDLQERFFFIFMAQLMPAGEFNLHQQVKALAYSSLL